MLQYELDYQLGLLAKGALGNGRKAGKYFLGWWGCACQRSALALIGKAGENTLEGSRGYHEDMVGEP